MVSGIRMLLYSREFSSLLNDSLVNNCMSLPYLASSFDCSTYIKWFMGSTICVHYIVIISECFVWQGYGAVLFIHSLYDMCMGVLACPLSCCFQF